MIGMLIFLVVLTIVIYNAAVYKAKRQALINLKHAKYMLEDELNKNDKDETAQLEIYKSIDIIDAYIKKNYRFV